MVTDFYACLCATNSKFRRDWDEKMYAALREHSGEDPRDVYNDAQALLAKQLEAEQESREQPTGTESRVDAN